MENVKFTLFDEDEQPQEELKRAYNRPRYKGISESLMCMLDEKDREIERLRKENATLKKALKQFIEGDNDK